MIEEYFKLFQCSAVHKIALIASVCSQVIRTFEQEFAKDPDGRNAAIDTFIELLQKHRAAPLPVEAEAQPTPPEQAVA